MQKSKKIEINLLIVFWWMVLGLVIVNVCFVLSTKFSGIKMDIISAINKTILALLILYNIWNVFCKINKHMLYYVMSFVLVILLHWCFGVIQQKDMNDFWDICITHLLTIFPLVVLILGITDFDLLLCGLKKISTVIVFIVVGLLVLDAYFDFSQYSMGLANALILPSNVFCLYFFKEKKARYLLEILICVLCIVQLGSRGALVGILLYVTRCFIRSTFNKDKILILCGAGILCVLVVCNIYTIAEFVSTTLIEYGFDSRTIRLLGNIKDGLHMSGRDEIYEVITKEIIRNPFAFRGIGGERALITKAYAHNIFLEVVCDFGIVFGSLFLAIVFGIGIKTITADRRDSYSEICLLFFCNSVPLLFFSGTLWEDLYFWLWIMLELKKVTVCKL